MEITSGTSSVFHFGKTPYFFPKAMTLGRAWVGEEAGGGPPRVQPNASPPSYCPQDNGPAAAQHFRGPRAAPAQTAWLPAPAELRGPEHLRPGGEAPSREEAPASRGRAAPQPHRRHQGDRPVNLWGPPCPPQRLPTPSTLALAGEGAGRQMDWKVVE